MAHILKESESRFAAAFDRPVIALKTTYDSKWKALIVGTDRPVICKPDTLFVELPERFSVVDSNYKEIKKSGKFYISIETIGPHHLLTDQP